MILILLNSPFYLEYIEKYVRINIKNTQGGRNG